MDEVVTFADLDLSDEELEDARPMGVTPCSVPRSSSPGTSPLCSSPLSTMSGLTGGGCWWCWLGDSGVLSCGRGLVWWCNKRFGAWHNGKSLLLQIGGGVQDSISSNSEDRVGRGYPLSTRPEGRSSSLGTLCEDRPATDGDSFGSYYRDAHRSDPFSHAVRVE